MVDKAMNELSLEPYPEIHELAFHREGLHVLCPGSIHGVSVHLKKPSCLRPNA
jgi:hypothetical protein